MRMTFLHLKPSTTYSLQLMSVDGEGKKSAWSKKFTIVTQSDIIPPPTPSAPTVTARLGAVMVAWDGLGSLGEVMPYDFKYCEVHASITSGFTPSPATMVGSVFRNSGTAITNLLYNTVYYFKLVAIDNTNNKSLGSAQATVTIVPLVNTDAINLVLSGTQIAGLSITAAQLASNAVDSSKILAGAVNSIFSQTTAPTGTGYKAGDLWINTASGNAISTWSGSAWVANPLGSPAIASGAIIAGKIAAGSIVAADISAGAIGATELAANAIIAGKIAAGAVTAGTIAALSIQAGDISSNAITADKINAGAITAVKIDTYALDSRTISGVTINGGVFLTSYGGSSRVEIGQTGGYPTDQIRMFNWTYGYSTVSSIRNPDDKPGCLRMSLGDGRTIDYVTTGDNHTGISANSGGLLKFLNSGAGFQVRNVADTVMIAMNASVYNVGASLSKLKTNITPLTIDTKTEIAKNGVHSWEWKHPDAAKGVHHGLLADDMPTWMREGDGYNINAVIAFLWQALRESNERIAMLEKK